MWILHELFNSKLCNLALSVKHRQCSARPLGQSGTRSMSVPVNNTDESSGSTSGPAELLPNGRHQVTISRKEMRYLILVNSIWALLSATGTLSTRQMPRIINNAFLWYY